MTSRLLEQFQAMVRIRRFEELLLPLFSEGLIRGSTHLAIGQEAVAVGVASALEPGDLVLATYRGHHHALARGTDPASAFGEILGRATGTCGGRGGSMHLTDAANGFLGENAIVGAHLPIAVGCAWSARIRRSTQVTVCFFGDGTTTIGAFHEALNLASLWKLPILFVCENNLYSEYSSTASVCPVPHPAASRATAYGLAPELVDGNDIQAVEEMARAAVARARAGDGCTLLEAQTYRHSGHSRADPATYRPAEEVAAWMARDPIAATERLLQAAGVSEDDLTRARASVEVELVAALELAKAAPEPQPGDLLDHVFAPTGHGSTT
jgi:acetoin:2,6-dichlorophenolindophenol oxidoreductase subunit alpha